ncbi:hypothetical protein [Oceanicola sp. S124]|uniref:hypothetical protein n=1 Tax=Oceanicola sp. S124 TaxID=1042378 RepID=UPI0002558512|nr:hypothetical protein [Oceanicola sp. S124]
MTSPDDTATRNDAEDRLAGLPVEGLPGTPWRYVLRPSQRPGAPLVIAAHGSDRDLRGLVEGLGMEGDVTLLAPVFPARIGGEDTGDDYKFLTGGGADYLALMDAILADALSRLPAAPARTWLFGFSGGAQFAQRYALFRAARLDGLILAAPGGVTLLRPDVDWWPGLAGAEAAVGASPDLAGMARLRTAILIGAEDRAAGLVDRAPGTRFGAARAGLAGASRQERARALHDDLAAHGTPVIFTEIPGVGHRLAPCAEAAAQILRDWLNEEKASTIQTTNRSVT